MSSTQCHFYLAIVVVCLSAFWGTIAFAAQPQPNTNEPSVVTLSATDRLARAKQALNASNFDQLRPLLEPALVPTSLFQTSEERINALELLSLGLFFEAQQTTEPQQRDALLERTKQHLLTILRQQPDHELDVLIYPASIVDIFEDLRLEYREELDTIRALQSPLPAIESSNHAPALYIEREVTTHNYIFNFAPFGLGQFQNSSPLKGSVFAVGQIMALGANILGYWMVESLRSTHGKYNTSGSAQDSDYARALGWQRVQYAGLAAFGAFYLWSVADAMIYFEPYKVHIRTLDKAPEELSHSPKSLPGEGVSGLQMRILW